MTDLEMAQAEIQKLRKGILAAMGACETEIRKFNEPYRRWPWQTLLKQLEDVLGDPTVRASPRV